MPMAAIVPIAAGIVSAVAGATSDDGESATSTTEVTPASWESVGSSSNLLWTKFFKEMFGVEPVDPDWENAGPSMHERMAQDNNHLRYAGKQYLNQMASHTKQSLGGGAKRLRDRNRKASKVSQGYTRPTFSFGIGDKKVDNVSKRQMMATDKRLSELDNIQDRQTAYQALNYKQMGDQLGRSLDYMNTFTPNKAHMEFFEKMYPILRDVQNQRFGHAGQSQTMSSTAPLTTRVGNAIDMGSDVTDLINAIYKPKQTVSPEYYTAGEGFNL